MHQVQTITERKIYHHLYYSGAVMALLLIEPVNATLGSELLLDTSQVFVTYNLWGLFMTWVT